MSTAPVQLSNGRYLVIGDGTTIRPVAIGSQPAPDAADVSASWRMWRRRISGNLGGNACIEGPLDYVRGKARTYATAKGAEAAAERVRAEVAAAAARQAEIARFMAA